MREKIVAISLLVFLFAGCNNDISVDRECAFEKCNNIFFDIEHNSSIHVKMNYGSCTLSNNNFIIDKYNFTETCSGLQQSSWLVDSARENIALYAYSEFGIFANLFNQLQNDVINTFRINLLLEEGNKTRLYSYVGWEASDYSDSNDSNYTILKYGIGALTPDGIKTSLDTNGTNLSGDLSVLLLHIKIDSLDEINISAENNWSHWLETR